MSLHLCANEFDMPRRNNNLGVKGQIIGLNEAAYYYDNGDDGTFGAFREVDSGTIIIKDLRKFADVIGVKQTDNIPIGLRHCLKPVNSERDRIFQIRDICDKYSIPYKYIEETEQGKNVVEKK